MATLGFPILPPNNLLSSEDNTIPYPAPSTFMAQFSRISAPQRIHFLIDFHLPALFLYFLFNLNPTINRIPFHK